MLFRKAAYPNPELIPLRQATLTTMLNCDGEQLLKSEGSPWQGYPTAHWDCSLRDITQIETDTTDTLATRLWEYRENLVNFKYFMFHFVHQEDFIVFRRRNDVTRLH